MIYARWACCVIRKGQGAGGGSEASSISLPGTTRDVVRRKAAAAAAAVPSLFFFLLFSHYFLCRLLYDDGLTGIMIRTLKVKPTDGDLFSNRRTFALFTGVETDDEHEDRLMNFSWDSRFY